MKYQNHVIDPTYFYDAIEEFSFDYMIYIAKGKSITDEGKVKTEYERRVIRGSLQSSGTRLQQSTKGNITSTSYNFYCKSLYRINIGDIIEYKNKFLLCTAVNDYDEYGVRSAECSQIQLRQYQDLRDYVRYLNGEVYV